MHRIQPSTRWFIFACKVFLIFVVVCKASKVHCQYTASLHVLHKVEGVWRVDGTHFSVDTYVILRWHLPDTRLALQGSITWNGRWKPFEAPCVAGWDPRSWTEITEFVLRGWCLCVEYGEDLWKCFWLWEIYERIIGVYMCKCFRV